MTPWQNSGAGVRPAVWTGRKDNDTLLWIESPDQLDDFAAHLLYAKQF